MVNSLIEVYQVWIQSFFWTGCHIKVKEPILPYYLLIAVWDIVGWILFSRLLALCEMQTVSGAVDYTDCISAEG